VAELFQRNVLVRFGDCDPAGIVFYPRYFEMFNNLVEDWCADGLGSSFHALHAVRALGLPTVRIQTEFLAPSRLGERLRAELAVVELGGASFTLAIRLLGEDGLERVRATLVLVLMDLKAMRATRIGEPMRERMAHYLVPQQN